MTSATWNYRVIRFDRVDSVEFAIHEVYYDNGKPTGLTANAVSLSWGEGFDDGVRMLEMMTKALSMPHLTPEDFK